MTFFKSLASWGCHSQFGGTCLNPIFKIKGYRIGLTILLADDSNRQNKQGLVNMDINSLKKLVGLSTVPTVSPQEFRRHFCCWESIESANNWWKKIHGYGASCGFWKLYRTPNENASELYYNKTGPLSLMDTVKHDKTNRLGLACINWP